jgi:hypothetical protein
MSVRSALASLIATSFAVTPAPLHGEPAAEMGALDRFQCSVLVNQQRSGLTPAFRETIVATNYETSILSQENARRQPVVRHVQFWAHQADLRPALMPSPRQISNRISMDHVVTRPQRDFDRAVEQSVANCIRAGDILRPHSDVRIQMSFNY